MKKSNEATGMIIEVPDSMNYKTKFPYPGFWTGTYQGLLPAITTHTRLSRQPKALVMEALNKSIEILNGEYSIFLTEKMWKIGELMNLNSNLPIQGRLGSNLDYIKSSPDGGRMEIAAKVFEPAITHLINQNSGVSNSQNNLQQFSNELSQLRNQQIRLNTSLAQIEATTPRELEVVEKERECQARSRRVEVLADELTQLQNTITALQASDAELKAMERELRQLTGERKMLETNMSSNNAQRYANVKQRIENIGQVLTKSNLNTGVIRDYQNLTRYKKQEYDAELKGYNTCVNQAVQMRNAYTNGVKEGQALWYQIKSVSAQIESSSNSVAKAQNSLSAFATDDTRNLVKVWAAHLSACMAEIEGGLFKSKYQATIAVQGMPQAMLAESLPIDPSVIRDFEDYNSALTDIADKISNEEYDLLDEIGRLGLAMVYVPGASRILSIKGMRQKDRYLAYRNLIEEILSQGQKLDTRTQMELINMGIGPADVQVAIQTTDELMEMRELIRHLADSRLNFKYGGAN